MYITSTSSVTVYHLNCDESRRMRSASCTYGVTASVKRSNYGEPGNNPSRPPRRGKKMIGILIAIVLAAVAYWVCLALGLPAIVALIAAVLVLLAGVPTGGYGLGSRWGGRRGTY